MNKYALVQNGTVRNVIMWDGVSQYPLEDGIIAIKLEGNISVDTGDTYNQDTGVFTSQPSQG